MTTTGGSCRSKHGLRTRPGRLLLSQTAVMGYFGLDPSAYAEEISHLGGPSQKTILRIMRGRTKTIRHSTQERLKQAIHAFEFEKLPVASGSESPKENNNEKGNEARGFAKKLFELIEDSEEEHILETIERHLKNLPNAAKKKNSESRKILYNLCIFHGFEHFLYHPRNFDFLVMLSPQQRAGKIYLPLSLWAKHHTLASTRLKPSSIAKNSAQLATELKISKQALHRYMTADRQDHLPKFRTMVKWSELLADSSRDKALTSLSRRSLFTARFLHSFYVDILRHTSLDEQEVINLFSFSEELRALWPSVFQR